MNKEKVIIELVATLAGCSNEGPERLIKDLPSLEADKRVQEIFKVSIYKMLQIREMEGVKNGSIKA